MNNSNILDDLKNILESITDNKIPMIEETMQAKDIEGWDSLNHILIMAEIESFFSIRFTSIELSELKNIGEIIEIIKLKQNKN